jgi:hypothetical protein
MRCVPWRIRKNAESTGKKLKKDFTLFNLMLFQWKLIGNKKIRK